MWVTDCSCGSSDFIISFLNYYFKGQASAYPDAVKHDPEKAAFDFYVPDIHQKHKKIKINPELLDAYVGHYQFGPVVLAITKDEGCLHVQVVGQEAYPIYPESETTFFYTAADIQISFVKNENGNVTTLVWHQSGRRQTAKKLDE